MVRRATLVIAQVHDVPETPVLAAMLAAALTIMTWRLRRGRRFTWPRMATGAVACLYGVIAAREVLQPFQIGIDRRYFPGWRAFVHLTPLYHAELSDLLLNALLFLPFGILLPLLSRLRSVARVTVAGLVLSFVIELTQLLLDVTVSVGRVADVNDVLGDVIGTSIGYLILQLSAGLPAFSRAIRVMTWPAPTPSPRSIHRHGTAAAVGTSSDQYRSAGPITDTSGRRDTE